MYTTTLGVLMDGYGLVLTGELRAVTQRFFRDKDNAPAEQTVIVVDTGRDRQLDEVNVRKDDLALVRGLDERRGETIALSVSVGNYRRLWLDAIK